MEQEIVTKDESTVEKIQEVKAAGKNLVKVRLLNPHTHEGIEYEAGDIVELDASSAAYVVDKAKSGVRI